ncbi:(E)-4-hydroxy-3-methylbut-2-enyl-diphosphate synthase [Roseivirga thermotolerans]|uniref:4-hydroxy-3-methylbut-2-en-1-yl diphosphate synthase (flavodoxin) n=1 Tax=Roseivirga thermotolerans TaxID=1758176 RepID=A0ABQ3I6A1_9BACT|nr:(E)-4-hydroxy-3-methylbut-2-enyl-diphosphate synthase [Roseivirga thermotolerans]GHE67939.1 4-hydroxy-3-methylbut-2-en-1-yl diphosphate synthase (flavodoxin) [Roseivirga thermotolerans]
MEPTISLAKKYCNSLVSYSRRKTIPVRVGEVIIGGDNPIVIQSMTTVDTMDTQGSVEQVLRMVEAGCELVRITAPSLKEAENLRNIKNELRKRGCHVPLVADIHFTPNAAELAAQIVEKVRINPGNYADKKRFESIEYTDETYQAELDRIRERFTPLVELCKKHGTAMRIGTNHGSLSDRIMSRYGDTALGMVESALEFLRICEDLNFDQIVLSMKSSNAQVMVEAYRLLVQKLDEEGLKPYPLHLGVTEAGEAEDGRIKSAVGIGTLLEDGLGDTVRVSLTEEPEFEAPVARKLVARYRDRKDHRPIPEIDESPIDPFLYHKRSSREVLNIGDVNVPRVIADMSSLNTIEVKDLKSVGHFYLPEPDKWTMNDQGADYIYSGNKSIPFMLPNGLKELVDYPVWKQLTDKKGRFPVYNLQQLAQAEDCDDQLNFIRLNASDIDEDTMMILEADNLVVLLETDNTHAMPALRRFFFELVRRKLNIPVVVIRNFEVSDAEAFLIHASTDIGGLLVDGFGDGVMLTSTPQSNKEGQLSDIKLKNTTAFGILQAARTRMTKTEYISCPSCGRTLFDLQETTAMIRKRTDHLKGVKIGIMGCIVNGPGEMADADYGYVGSGKGKITLYKGQEVMKRGVPSEQAVDELIEIIRADGKWIEPKAVEV